MNNHYSSVFLASIGLIAVEWAKLELEMKTHTSAMTAQRTHGKPLNRLDIGFTALRKLWTTEMKARFPRAAAKKAEQLNSRLADLANERDIAIHANWSHTGRRGIYRAWTLKQPDLKGIEIGETTATPQLLRSVAHRIADANAELRMLTRGKHGGKHKRARLV